MTPHPSHPTWPYSDSCPDCAGYPDEPTGADYEAFLQFVLVLGVIVAVAVIVRLAVSR